MGHRASDNLIRIAAVLAVMTPVLVSCNDGHTTTGDSMSGGRAAAEPSGPALDFGEDWADAAPSRGTGSTSPEQPVWGVVLMTFTDDGHQIAASNMLRALPTIDPKLSIGRATVFAVTVEKPGGVVVSDKGAAGTFVTVAAAPE